MPERISHNKLFLSLCQGEEKLPSTFVSVKMLVGIIEGQINRGRVSAEQLCLTSSGLEISAWDLIFRPPTMLTLSLISWGHCSASVVQQLLYLQ